jgi:hypothetical protein
MTWAMKRRLLILAVIATVVLIGVLTTAYFTVYEAPSCTDGKQNQSEEGSDCGGPCPYLCAVSQIPPSVRFARALSPFPGRTDVIAYIDNSNPTSAARNVHYTIELYSDRNTVVARSEGVTDIPAGDTVPIYMPNFFSGSEVVARTFVSFNENDIQWFKVSTQPIKPTVSNIVLTQEESPRVTAQVFNPSPTPMKNVRLVATVFDVQGNALAASATVAPLVPPQGASPIIFTWPAPFGGIVSRVEVVPLLTPEAP